MLLKLELKLIRQNMTEFPLLCCAILLSNFQATVMTTDKSYILQKISPICKIGTKK